MKRRHFLAGSVLTAAAARSVRAALVGGAPGSGAAGAGVAGAASLPSELKLTPPASGPIDVAFCISEGSNVIDMAGPWEVFQDVTLGEGHEYRPAFRLFTVAETKTPVRATGGLHLIPDHAFGDTPPPRVVVVPAMKGSKALHAWLVQVAGTADLVMSVCTGAFQLARAGLLDGREATTHHHFWDDFAKSFPKVKLQRGPRFVEGPRIATAGGLTSGIDLALRVVERHFGREVAQATAAYMEYSSEAWQV